jgi:hypothetical protein
VLSNDRSYANQTTEHGPMKPWIALGGDDDGCHYILFPQSEDREDFNYDLVKLMDSGKGLSTRVRISIQIAI